MAPYYTYEPCGSAARYGRTPAGRARACRVFPIMVFYQNSPSPGSFELIYRVLNKNVCRYIYQCHSSRINGCFARATRRRVQLYKYFNGTLSLAHQGYTMSVNSVRVMVGAGEPALKGRRLAGNRSETTRATPFAPSSPPRSPAPTRPRRARGLPPPARASRPSAAPMLPPHQW